MSLWMCPKCATLTGPEYGPCPKCGTPLEYATIGQPMTLPDPHRPETTPEWTDEAAVRLQMLSDCPDKTRCEECADIRSALAEIGRLTMKQAAMQEEFENAVKDGRIEVMVQSRSAELTDLRADRDRLQQERDEQWQRGYVRGASQALEHQAKRVTELEAERDARLTRADAEQIARQVWMTYGGHRGFLDALHAAFTRETPTPNDALRRVLDQWQGQTLTEVTIPLLLADLIKATT